MPRKITVSLPDPTLREYLDAPPGRHRPRVGPDRGTAPAADRHRGPALHGQHGGPARPGAGGHRARAEPVDRVRRRRGRRCPPGRVFANAAGVHETSTAELTLALILASQREFPRLLQNQQEGRWETRPTASLADRRVLIVGYGGVGKAIEDRLLPFETTVTRVASRERTDERGHVHGIAELHTLLPEHDIVIVGVPLSDSTRHLIDDAFLAAMPDGALLVNVARGPVADTDALVRHTASRPDPRRPGRHRSRAAAAGPPAVADPRRHHQPARGRGELGDAPADGPAAAAPDRPDAGRRSRR